MSYSVPASYVAAASPQVAVPSMLNSDPLLQFKGSRSVLKYIPSSSGTYLGPAASAIFQIPMSAYGFIKPNSMYLRCKYEVTGTSDPAATWMFAGQNGVAGSANMPLASLVGKTLNAGQVTAGGQGTGLVTIGSITPAGALPVTTVAGVRLDTPTDVVSGSGSASSVIQRLTVQLPGGVSMSYPQYNHFRNAILPHALSYDFITNDLRQLEHATWLRSKNTLANYGVDGQGYVAIPLNIPVFNSPQAFPLCSIAGGITIELVTETAALALFSSNADAGMSYRLSEMALVYEELVVSPEFKEAIKEQILQRPYTIGVSDVTYLGVVPSQPSRTNIGVGLTSLKGVVGAHQLQVTGVDIPKKYVLNSIDQFNVYINGSQVTPSNLDSDAMQFAEFTRALQVYTDAKIPSYLPPIASVNGSTVRNAYGAGQYAFGITTAAYDDAAFALAGVPADQIQIELQNNQDNAAKQQDLTANVATALCYLWALHDSVVRVMPDGTCSVQK